MRDFRDVMVWGKARTLTSDIYRVTGAFPATERYGLAQQLRSASVSVVANIAEGCGRSAPGDFRRCLEIASGSAAELEALLILSGDLGYLNAADQSRLQEQTVEIKKMLAAFIARIRSPR